MRNSMTSFPLYGPASAMGSFDFTSIRPRPSFLRGISRRNTAMIPTLQKDSCRSELDYDSAWSNDGVVPLFSQWHPFSCK